ncbi:sensor histidine kinase [Thalassotalea sp. PLHSN55]|uniref:sensor histidine kinase n=1 Tax=Thalassotalea sp. PLHSN55 TaxID=3435888 RepID=UPI003F85B47D
MSIRNYLFIILTSMVLIIASFLSFQSARIFIGSFERSMAGTMREIAERYPKEGTDEAHVLDFYVTTDWQKVPSKVKEYFPTIPENSNRIQSKFVDWVYFAPPQKSYSLLTVKRNNQLIFITHINENIHQEVEEKYGKQAWYNDPMIFIALLGVSGIVIFILAQLYAFRKVTMPVQHLHRWAKDLQIEDLKNTPPDFQFKELNALAAIIHSNLSSVANSVEREQEFLRYASHELRTPIAVLRSNTALLEKVNPEPSDKERKIRDRIQRASLTMKSMTETLLWLSREGETELISEPCSLGNLLATMQAELSYLLSGKQVSVDLVTDNTEITIETTPVIIVLNNLIRNAFQHTQHGQVDIVQCGSEVVITNVEMDDASQVSQKTTAQELGFGLGMQLVEKLVLQFGWQYTIKHSAQSYQVLINFKRSEPVTNSV